MARPRTLKVGSGEVILKNLSKEDAERIIGAINAGQLSAALEDTSAEAPKTTDETGATTLDTSPTVPLKFRRPALGTYKNEIDGKYYLVEIRFNPYSKVAAIVDQLDCGQERDLMWEKFRLAAVDYNMGEG